MKPLALVLSGIVGGVIGALAAGWVAGDDEPARARTTVARGGEDPSSSAAFQALERRLKEVEARLVDAESRAPAGGGTVTGTARPPATARDAGGATGPAEPAEAPVRAEPVDAWLPALLVGKFESEAVGELFGRLTRDPRQIAETVRRIEAAIEKDPANPELRVALATALVARLQNETPPGIQQGIVWGQADQAYAKAIELDPAHWTARYSRAFGTTFIPAQFGRRPEAIRQFEDLIALQEQDAPRPEHAQSYFQLGRLYGESGNVEKAREVWRRGLTLFPDDDQLKETLEVSSKR